jgi:methylated-DNA-[protein]-cysteine S-methyltransferase
VDGVIMVEMCRPEEATHARRRVGPRKETPMNLETTTIPTPIGRLTLVARAGALVAIAFEGEEAEMRRRLEARFGGIHPVPGRDPAGAVTALRAYFKGDLAALDRIKVDLGGTTFQESVWSELRRIPAGSAISYAELASRVGNPKAMRAVGTANGSNPVPVIVPCHRVIAKDGTLGGYGGGLDRKRLLLEHERAFNAAAPSPSRPPRVRTARTR